MDDENKVKSDQSAKSQEKHSKLVQNSEDTKNIVLSQSESSSDDSKSEGIIEALKSPWGLIGILIITLAGGLEYIPTHSTRESAILFISVTVSIFVVGLVSRKKGYIGDTSPPKNSLLAILLIVLSTLILFFTLVTIAPVWNDGTWSTLRWINILVLVVCLVLIKD